MSSNNGNGNNAANRRPAATPAKLRFGGRKMPIIESDDSSSDQEEQSGGARLDGSPYRPPQVRAAAAATSSANDGGNPTPESTDDETLVTARMANMTFQRGLPAGTNVFNPAPQATDDHVPTAQEIDDIIMANARATGHPDLVDRDEAAGPVVPHATHNQDQGRQFMRRPASNRHLVGGEDAQRVYPPSACVFIANLPHEVSDETIEARVTREFSRYGKVYVKIKRDDKKLPFCFAQFTNDHDAQLAIAYGDGTDILGRHCRAEKAKANCTFVVVRNDGTLMTRDEVMSIVSGRGELLRVEPVSQEMADEHYLHGAYLVEFAAFDPDRDIAHRYKSDFTHRVIAWDPRKANPFATADEAFLERYEKDRNSVFVAGLPWEVTEEQLRGVMEQSGDVVQATVVQRGRGSIGFVEFSRPDMPNIAIQQWDGVRALNTILRVSQKITRERTSRRVPSGHFRTPGSYPRRTPGRRNFTAGPSTFTPARGAYTPAQAGYTHDNPYLDAQAAPAPTFIIQPRTSKAVRIVAPADVKGKGNADATPPVVVSSQSTPTTTITAPAPTTQGGSLAVPTTQLSAMAPPFGGNFNQSSALMGGFQAPGNFGQGFNAGGAFNDAQFMGAPNFGGAGQNFGGASLGFQAPQVPVMKQFTGFVFNGVQYIQDPVSGCLHPLPAIAAPIAPMMNTNPAFGQRAMSAMQFVPASQHLQRTSDENLRREASNQSLRSKKSVTFADPVVQGSPEAGPSGTGGASAADKGKGVAS